MIYNPNPNLRVLTIIIPLLILILSLFYMYNLRLGVNSVIYENKTKTNQVEASSSAFSQGEGTGFNPLPLGEGAGGEVKTSIDLLFVGDIMTDRYIRKQINRFGSTDTSKSKAENFNINYLNNLSSINSNYDYVVANLEGPITENKSLTLNDDGTYGQDLLFTLPTSTTEILKILNIRAVSLANNHTDNFYHAGLVSTKRFLDNDNIRYYGNPYNSNEDKLSETICEKDICIAYIGYNQFTKGNDNELIIKEIERLNINKVESDKELKPPDFIVVMAHWGEEYDKTANEMEKIYARSWIDAGVDLVIGAHPHVVQEIEEYKGKYIAYSLGNYIFDQWFDPDVKKGLALHFRFVKENSSTGVELVEKKNVSIDRNGVRYEE